MKIILPKEKKFLLIGSGDPIKILLKILKEKYPKVQAVVFSERECDENWSMYEKEGIEVLAKRCGYPIFFPKDIHSEEAFKVIADFGCNVALSMGCRWIFRASLISLFNSCFFNRHPAPLPLYKGAGGFRWQVMNNEKVSAVTIHQITGEIDGGRILLKKNKKLKSKNVCPRDFFESLNYLDKQALGEFMRLVMKNKTLDLSGQNKTDAVYFPLLDNEINGAIDFSWQAKDVKLFINAFSYPYNGAFAFYRDKKIRILSAKIIKSKIDFHPFVSGLVLDNTGGDIKVASLGAQLLLSDLRDENNNKLDENFIRVGERLYNTPDILLRSRTYRPSNKNFILKTKYENKDSQ